MGTNQYFHACIALPAALCIVGMAFDHTGFMPILLVGAVVYLPVGVYAWRRIQLATQMDALMSVGLVFPAASSVLLAAVFAVPEIVGGDNGSPFMAIAGMIAALVVGYLYVLLAWVVYFLLTKAGLVANEFAVKAQ